MITSKATVDAEKILATPLSTGMTSEVVPIDPLVATGVSPVVAGLGLSPVVPPGTTVQLGGVTPYLVTAMLTGSMWYVV